MMMMMMMTMMMTKMITRVGADVERNALARAGTGRTPCGHTVWTLLKAKRC